MKVKTLAIDLAKTVFQLHGADARDKPVFQRRVTRAKLLSLVLRLAPTVIVMEACGGAHYWARLFRSHNIEVRLIPPQHVKPYVQGNKNDRRDAEAIFETSLRPRTPYVAIKSVDHQTLQALHRLREQQQKSRTALINQLHGLLSEYGYIFPTAHQAFRQAVRELLDNPATDIPAELRAALYPQLELWQLYDAHIKCYEGNIKQWVQQHGDARRLTQLPGVAHIIASALVMYMGNPGNYRNARHFSTSLGLVPKHRGSGHKTVILGISKRGDSYVRKQLIHGARAFLRTAANKTDGLSCWACALLARRGWNRTVVAVANKLARIAWALLATGKDYQAPAAA